MLVKCKLVPNLDAFGFRFVFHLWHCVKCNMSSSNNKLGIYKAL